jgi:hypothetical protein
MNFAAALCVFLLTLDAVLWAYIVGTLPALGWGMAAIAVALAQWRLAR